MTHLRVTGSFAEFGEVRVTDPLRQGDVLEAVDPAASMWQRHLLVITADCDFAHGKHQGRVTCVPLLRSDEYLLELQVPRMREKYITTKLLPALQGVLADPGAPKVSDDRLRAWPEEARWIRSLTASDSTAAPLKLLALRSKLFACSAGAAHRSTTRSENLVSAQLAGPSPQGRRNILKAITEALKGPYSQPPGDALFVSALGQGARCWLLRLPAPPRAGVGNRKSPSDPHELKSTIAVFHACRTGTHTRWSSGSRSCSCP